MFQDLCQPMVDPWKPPTGTAFPIRISVSYNSLPQDQQTQAACHGVGKVGGCPGRGKLAVSLQHLPPMLPRMEKHHKVGQALRKRWHGLPPSKSVCLSPLGCAQTQRCTLDTPHPPHPPTCFSNSLTALGQKKKINVLFIFCRLVCHKLLMPAADLSRGLCAAEQAREEDAQGIPSLGLFLQTQVWTWPESTDNCLLMQNNSNMLPLDPAGW